MTDLYIISGFLGAGKTTLIEKLINQAFQNQKVVIIENDFGEASVDAALLRTPNIQVKELSSGCICCSLSGDFVKALLDLLKRFHPDKILIEPSGVSKLSDIIKSCSNAKIKKHASIQSVITVVDVKRCKKHLENFGEFFEDQIKQANVILLSHTKNNPKEVKETHQLIKNINDSTNIISKPISQLTSLEVLCPQVIQPFKNTHQQPHCHHKAHEVFETITIHTNHKYSTYELKSRIKKMEHLEHGTILRAKGIIPGTNGYINLQYIPGDIVITRTSTSGNVLSIIGQNLNRQKLITLFDGE